jgi:hypothetical protein
VALAQIVCRGLGPGTTIALLVTAGYGGHVARALEPATPGPLTAAQIARLRGWQAPPRRPREADETDGDERGEAQSRDATFQGAGRGGSAPTLTTLLATARRVDPGPDWARVLTLAALDFQRRQAQAQAQAADDEAALVLMLVLLEVV